MVILLGCAVCVLGVSVTLQAVGIGQHSAGMLYKSLKLDNKV